MILLLFIFSQKGNHYLASIFGVFAILFRQTNIIWVGMVFGCYILKEINAVHHNKPKSSNLQATPKVGTISNMAPYLTNNKFTDKGWRWKTKIIV